MAKKMSVAEVLAAARAEKAGGAAPPPAAADSPTPPEAPAAEAAPAAQSAPAPAAKPAAPAGKVAPGGKGMSMADILAAARAGKGGAAPAPKAAVTEKPAKPPVVVASPDGQYVAMASDENRELRVIPASSLFGPRVAARPMRSDGLSIGAAAFVTRNATKDTGLALRSTSNPIRSLAASDWILDVGSGHLARATGDWQLNSATNLGWQATLDPAGVFQWTGPQARGSMSAACAARGRRWPRTPCEYPPAAGGR